MEDVINVGLQLVASNPKTAGFLAAVPLIQGLGWLLSVILPKHTIAAKIGHQVAAFPVKVAKPVADPAVLP